MRERIKLIWERMDSALLEVLPSETKTVKMADRNVERARMAGGWLVLVSDAGEAGMSLTFVPDAEGQRKAE